MRFYKSLLIAMFVGVCTLTQAQDMHYSMFDMAPLELNPTYTGYYAGTFRIGGIYRTQWGNLSTTQNSNGSPYPGLANSNVGNFSGFQTPSAYIDVPFGIPKKGNAGAMKSWMGAGVSFYLDQVGSLSTLSASLSLAYHIGLGKKGNTLISIGAQGGLIQYRAGSASDYVFEDQIMTGTTQESFQNSNVSVADFSGGLMLSHRARKLKFQLAASVNHFTMPEYNFLSVGADEKVRQPMTMLANFIMKAEIAKRLQLKPLIFFHNQLTGASNIDGNGNAASGGFSSFELNAQLLLGIHFNDQKDITLYLGGGYRISDAIIARIGLDIKGFRFGFAYDINPNGNGISASTFSKSNTGMAFEVALSYTAKIYKVPQVKDVLFCPRF